MIKRVLLAAISVAVFSAGPVYAEEAKVLNMTVKNTRDNLLLYFELQNSFTENILKAVNSGVKISFTFPVQLYQKRRMWPDKNIIDINLHHTLKYDALKKEYVITRSWNPEKTITVKTLEEAKKYMNHVDGFTLVLLEQLVKGELYQARVKAEQDRLTLPYYLKYFLFFLSFWEFETDWCLIDFQY